jgi:branched-chain amino acid transport system ATP-binding protein
MEQSTDVTAEQQCAVLEMKDVRASYGSFDALCGVSLSINHAEIAALVGPHGGGKSAALKAICGLLPVRSGDILFEGSRINGSSVERLVGKGIVYVDEQRLIFASMSVMDNLVLGAYARRRRTGANAIRDDIETVLTLFPILRERQRQSAGTLSGGEKQMLSIGRAFMAAPRLLLLDCPSLRLAPILVRKVMGAISELRNHGITTLLVEQNVKAVSHIADRGYFMEQGRVVAEGSPAELLSQSSGSRLVS